MLLFKDCMHVTTKESSTPFSVPTSTATTLAPILENGPPSEEEFVTIQPDSVEEGSVHDSSTTSTKHNSQTTQTTKLPSLVK